ncbi:hemerythrin family protein [Pseudomonadota bacterium]
MTYFKWDSDLDVGVEKLNDQHKELIARMELVYEADQTGVKDDVISAVQHLMESVIIHFKDEEEYLASINYPTLDAHKKIHKNLITDMGTFADTFVNGSKNTLGDEFMAFLNMWVTTHIMAIDTKYHPDGQ